jgi:integrase
VRAGIEDLRAYDLRHTFATRLLERGLHHFAISALLGHSTPMTGFGFLSCMTPGYAHATWDTMVAAVATLEESSRFRQSVAVRVDATRVDRVRKVG